ncbi:hypothetical protein HG531_006465 [Fusarium graminearum]|nr:hypothetical protein HG531_006465 [Fusarium graminearum]
MTVKSSSQTLLVKEMGNKTNASAEDEETVENTHLEVVLSLLGRESTAVADKINEANSNATVNVENEVVLLGSGDSLNSKGVVEKLVAGEVVEDVLLNKLDTEIGVVSGLDTVTNTRNELVGLAHAIDEIAGAETLVEGTGELLSSTVKSTTKSAADWGETAAEPQQRHDTTNADILLENVGDGHAGVEKLLTTVIGNGGDEGSGLSDETKLLGPRVIERNLGNNGLGLGNDGALGDEVIVDLLEGGWEILKGGRDVETSLLHLLVLHLGSLKLRVGERTSVTELDLSLEHAGAGTNGPGDNRLGDDALLDGLDDLVLLDTTDLAKQDKDLALGIGLVSQKMVDESGTGVSVTTNGNTLVNTIGVLGDDVVELVGHTTRLGDVTNGTLAVELGGNDVVHHTTSVTDLEAAGLDTTDGGGANDGNTLLLGNTYSLRDTLSNDGNGLDLGVLHELHGRAVDTSGRSKVDDNIDVGVLLHGLSNLLVDRQQSLAGSPVHLADELAAKGVDNTGDRGLGSLADEVEVEHALDGSRLETVDEASRLVGEESVVRKGAQRPAGSRESLNVVVGRQAVRGSGSHCEYRARRCGGGERVEVMKRWGNQIRYQRLRREETL